MGKLQGLPERVHKHLLRGRNQQYQYYLPNRTPNPFGAM